MGISIKKNHLLKLKYSLHISETVFRIVVLISIDTWITVVLQIYTLKLRDSSLIMLKMYSPPPATGLKLICQRQWMKRTSLWNRVQKISHDMLNSMVNI